MRATSLLMLAVAMILGVQAAQAQISAEAALNMASGTEVECSTAQTVNGEGAGVETGDEPVYDFSGGRGLGGTKPARPRYKKGDVLPDGRVVGTSRDELPVNQGDLDRALAADSATPAAKRKAAALQKLAAARDKLAANLARKGQRATPRERRQLQKLEAKTATLCTEVQREMGGPAAPWAKAAVEQALKDGIMKGCRPEATADDNDWRLPLRRDDAALALERLKDISAADARLKVDVHNTDEYAHTFIQNLIGAEVSQRANADETLYGNDRQLALWLWIVGAAVLLIVMSLSGSALRARRSRREGVDRAPDDLDGL